MYLADSTDIKRAFGEESIEYGPGLVGCDPTVGEGIFQLFQSVVSKQELHVGQVGECSVAPIFLSRGPGIDLGQAAFSSTISSQLR